MESPGEVTGAHDAAAARTSEAKSDGGATLFGRRSALFLPASNPRAIARAREAGADLVILDLEDAVPDPQKAVARDAAIAAVAEPWPCLVGIRINGTASEWHCADLAAVARSAADFAVLPRADDAAAFASVAAQIGRPLLAMIETPRGVLAAPAIAMVAAALLAGTNDLSASLRLPTGSGRQPLQTALQTVVIAARAAGIPCFDGVFNRLDDEPGFASEAAESRALGFDGKTLIHPSQVAPCHAVFAPTPAERARAERLIAEAAGGAQRFEGEMVEAMHVAAARRLLGLS